jgi:5-methylcytosine-specific restriction enzyme subunit McrC
MYQAYAYGRKYGASIVYLIYPWTPGISEVDQPIVYDSGDGVEVRTIFLNVSQGKSCVDGLWDELMKSLLR